MSSRPRPLANAVLAIGFAALAACAPPPPPAPPPAKQEAPPPSVPPSVAESPPPASAAAPPPEPESTAAPKSRGGIPVLKMDSEEIVDTFGSAPAKLELGEQEKAILRIPENALTGGVNITFKIEKKGKAGGGLVGKIYRITPVIPPAGEPTKVDTAGAPFDLALPAGNKKDANLAIGVIATDDKGKEKIVWTVIAPLKIDDATATAHFEIPSLSDAFLHVTTRAVTPPAAP